MSYPIVRGSTDQSVVIRIVDSTDGLPEMAVEHNTAGIDLWYRREGGLKVSITESSLAALNSAHVDGGIEHMGDGYYRLDLPDAAVAAGANYVTVGGAVTGMVVIGTQHPLVDQIALNASGHVTIADGTLTSAKVVTTLPASLDATQTAAVADKILGRNIAGGADGGRTIKQAFGVIRNKVSIDTGNNLLVVYDTDDTTILWTAAITTAVRNPLASVDPT